MSLKRFSSKIEIGCDEAGRGSLSGPVVASAVILPKNFKNSDLDDSKKLSLRKREELSKIILEKYWEKFILMCQFEHDPFEQPLHDIYKLEYCLSPIPSLALHCTNINSIFGLSPNIDWEKIWEENKIF